MELQDYINGIGPLDRNAVSEALKRQASLAKPPGSLGRLEALGTQLAGICGAAQPRCEKKRLLVFAADNGVVAEGVSSAPQSVTLAQTVNLTRGLTGAAVLARRFGAELEVIDVGVAADVPCAAVVPAKIAYGTRNIAEEPAMDRDQAVRAITTGILRVEKAKREGVDIIGVGEMGIGNTTTSSAVLAALTGRSAGEVTGRGGGLESTAFLNKKILIDRAVERLAPDRDDPVDVLAKLGGFDIAAMCGAFLGAAYFRMPAVVDGFISAVAALAAARLSPLAVRYMLPSHGSAERGFAIAMEELGLTPYFKLDMRLGEGSGCPFTFMLAEAACAVLSDMGSFEDAGIDDGYLEPIRKDGF